MQPNPPVKLAQSKPQLLLQLQREPVGAQVPSARSHCGRWAAVCRVGFKGAQGDPLPPAETHDVLFPGPNSNLDKYIPLTKQNQKPKWAESCIRSPKENLKISRWTCLGEINSTNSEALELSRP